LTTKYEASPPKIPEPCVGKGLQGRGRGFDKAPIRVPVGVSGR